MSKLAIQGGTPVRKEPFPSRSLIGKEEKQAVLEIMDRAIENNSSFDRYNGIEVDAFEKEFADYYGTEFATAVSSGTAALHSSLGALRLDAGMEVIAAPITDTSGVMTILFNACIPVFPDTTPEMFTSDPASIEALINPRTGAIIVTHIGGNPANMPEIEKISKKYNIPLIEDCAQAHGASIDGRLVGTWGTLGAFSLMSSKHMTSGGQGGMVITNTSDLYWNAKRFADRGKPFNSEEEDNLFIGLNYRMTELEAGIGRTQLKKLDKILETRRKIMAHIGKGMKEIGSFQLMPEEEGAVCTYWYAHARTVSGALNADRETVVNALNAEGLPAILSYRHAFMPEKKWLVNKQTFGTSKVPWSYYKNSAWDYKAQQYPNATNALDTYFRIPVNESWTLQEADDYVEALAKINKAYLA